MLDLLRSDLSKGAVMSLLFDETTDCTDKHPVNIILATRYCVCYITTTFIARESTMNNNTAADAIITAWEPLGLPRTRVALVLVDKAGHCSKAFNDHSTVLFSQAKLRTC